MNILQIISKFDSYDAIKGALDLSKCLTKNKHNCIVASFIEPQILELDSYGMQYYHLSSSGPNIKNPFILYKKVKDIIKNHNIDVVHTHSSLNSWFAFLLCRKNNIPLVTTFYDFYSNNLLNFALTLSKKIIVHHEAVGKYLMSSYNLPRERMQLIKQGIYLEELPFYGIDTRSKTDFNIGIILSLSSLKGDENFLKAIVKVIRIIPHIKISIVDFLQKSRPNIREDLQLTIRRLGLANCVNFLDISNFNSEFLSNINILVSTFDKENTSTRIILEAQAYGVSVIATQVAGIAEVVVNGKTGILVAPQDNNVLAEAIIEILQNFQLTREITGTARQRIEQDFNIENNIERFIDVYQEAKNKIDILVVNIGNTKEVISSIPPLRILRNGIPNSKITCLINPVPRSLLQRCPYVDELVVYDDAHKLKRLLSFVNILKLLIRKRFDIVFDFNNSLETNLLSYLCLASKRYGYKNRFLKFLINFGIKKPIRSLGLVRDKLAIVSSSLDTNEKDCKLELWPSEKDLEFADSFLKDGWVGNANIAAVDVSSKKRLFGNFKTTDCLAYLCDRLASQQMRVIVFGVEDDSTIRENLLKKIKSKPILAAPNISPLQLACLVKECAIHICSNLDSLYIAMAMKVPSIILSAAKNEIDFSPYKNIEILNVRDVNFVNKTKRKRINSDKEEKDILIDKINKLIQSK